MAEPLKKVASGDPLAIPAETFNTFIDMARDYRSRQVGVVAGRSVRPIAAYVEQVYPYGDFALLGIGT